MSLAGMSSTETPGDVCRIEKLPRELLAAILGFLCPHCSAEQVAAPSTYHPGTAALKQLSLTSKRCRMLALSFLLHRAQQVMLIGPLTRLIATYPELGYDFKSPIIPLFQNPSHEDYDFLKQATSRLLQSVGDEEPLENREDGPLCRALLGAELFMALTPRACAVRIQVTEPPDDFRRDTFPILSRFLKRSAPEDDFRNVRFLVIEGLPQDVGIRLYSPSVKASLAAFASRLQHLKLIDIPVIEGWAAASEPEPMPLLPELLTLELEGCRLVGGHFDLAVDGSLGALRRLVEQAPKLREFRLSRLETLPNWPGFDARLMEAGRALSVLTPRLPALRHLSLDYKGLLLVDRDDDHRVLAAEALADIESVELTAATFCHSTTTTYLPVRFHDICCRSCLINALPPNVKHVHVILGNPWATWNDIKHVGRCVQSERELQNLATLKVSMPKGWNIDMDDDDEVEALALAVEELHEAFDETGVEITLEDNELVY